MTFQQLEVMTPSIPSNYERVGMSDWEEAQRYAEQFGDTQGLGDAIYDDEHGAAALGELGVTGPESLNSRAGSN